VHASADKDRRRKIDADGFDLIPIGASFPLLDRCPAQRLGAIGIWAVRDPASVCRHMDVESDRPATETPADSAGKDEEAKGLVWEARVSAWEREIREGRPLSAETLAEAIDLDEIESLEPDLIRRIHRLLFRDREAPPQAEPADEPSTPAGASQPPAEETRSFRTSPEADETDEGRRAQFKETLDLLDQSVAQAASPSRRLDQSFIKTIIREVASDLLKVQDMDEREAFQNYGMDSVFGVQLAIRLEKRLGREIQPRWLIDFPSIRALSEHLQELEEVADAE
jgi:acyl carrier protein